MPPDNWRQRPTALLLVLACVMPLTFSVWNALLNNFVVERAAFTGREIGILQSLREIPGFLSFTVIFLLMVVREQRLALLSLLVLAGGVAVTGLFPSALGLYLTTVFMSIGFHYFEAINESLTLQWLPKQETTHFMGRVLAVKAVASLLAYSSIWLLMDQLGVDYPQMYLLAGGCGLLIIVAVWVTFPTFEQHTLQHKKIILRRRYWVYYGLFAVFAGYAFVTNAGVSFTINHIAAVVIPVVLGMVWLVSPAAVFLSGAGFALLSLCLARLIPRHPEPGLETRWPGYRYGVQR